MIILEITRRLERWVGGVGGVGGGVGGVGGGIRGLQGGVGAETVLPSIPLPKRVGLVLGSLFIHTLGGVFIHPLAHRRCAEGEGARERARGA